MYKEEKLNLFVIDNDFANIKRKINVWFEEREKYKLGS